MAYSIEETLHIYSAPPVTISATENPISEIPIQIIPNGSFPWLSSSGGGSCFFPSLITGFLHPFFN